MAFDLFAEVLFVGGPMDGERGEWALYQNIAGVWEDLCVSAGLDKSWHTYRPRQTEGGRWEAHYVGSSET